MQPIRREKKIDSYQKSNRLLQDRFAIPPTGDCFKHKSLGSIIVHFLLIQNIVTRISSHGKKYNSKTGPHLKQF